MKEISIILKHKILITVEEFRLLDAYSHYGKILTVVQKPTSHNPFTVTHRSLEYIFDDEALTFFRIISCNILASWDTDQTRDLLPDQEFYIKDSLYVRPYVKSFDRYRDIC